MASEHELVRVLIDARRTFAARYGIVGTPAAVLVDGTGRIASAPATGPAAIEVLIRRALRRPEQFGAPELACSR